LLPSLNAASATTAENVDLKQKIEDLRRTPPGVQDRPATPAGVEDDQSAKRQLIQASNAARSFLAGRSQEWAAPKMPSGDGEQSPDAAIAHATRTLEGAISLRSVDTDLDEFLATLHRLRAMPGEPRVMEARREEIASVNEHLRQLGIERQEAAARLAEEQRSAPRNSFPDFVATDSYTMLRLPHPEYRQGLRGAYYLVNLPQAVFKRSRYVLDPATTELVKRSAQQFSTEVLSRIPGNNRATIFIRGTADDGTWRGDFIPGREYRQLKIFSGELLRGYDSESKTVQLAPPLPNTHLPDLRAAHLQDILSSTKGFETAEILKGHYCQRQAELIVHVDW
jgi:hypothetical protein